MLNRKTSPFPAVRLHPALVCERAHPRRAARCRRVGLRLRDTALGTHRGRRVKLSAMPSHLVAERLRCGMPVPTLYSILPVGAGSGRPWGPHGDLDDSSVLLGPSRGVPATACAEHTGGFHRGPPI